MRKLKFLLPLLLLGVMLCGVTVSAYNEVNEYKGVYYGDSVEKVTELEKIVQADGYYNIKDNSELAEKLSNDWDYWYCTPAKISYKNNDERYNVWVTDEAVKTYLNGDITLINENSVISSTYELVTVEQSTHNGKIGNDIPEGTPTTNIYVAANVPEELKNQSSPIYVILYNDEDGARYELDLSPYNDFAKRTKVPAGHYFIEGANIGDGYTCHWNSWWDEGVTLRDGQMRYIYISVNDMELWDDTPETEKVDTSQLSEEGLAAYNEWVEKQEADDTETDEVVEEVVEVVEEPETTSSFPILPIVGVIIVILVGALCYFGLKRARNKDNGDF